MSSYYLLINCGVIALFFVFITFLIKNSKKDLLSSFLSQSKKFEDWQIRWQERNQIEQSLREQIHKLLNEHKEEQHQQRVRFDEYQLHSLKNQNENLQRAFLELRQLITEVLQSNTQTLSQRMEKLTQDTEQRLKEISQQVETRLNEGFEKTTATFTDVVKRLALIDEAQKKITELSSNVISLQEILSDKRSRGVFGEVQLATLINNVMPERTYQLQYTLSNNKRVDCILFLPEPTGNIAIDAKFPLESFQKFSDHSLPEGERQVARQQFQVDIKHHIQEIASKYIIPNETADGAVMFIPAEAIFAEIHAHYPELVETAYRQKVWLVSPTTMMAVLTTARAVLKDAATRKQVHLIQDHLVQLGKDFSRFQTRMENLAKHIKQAHNDVEEVHLSSKKITSRFNKIEKVELIESDITSLELDKPSLLQAINEEEQVVL